MLINSISLLSGRFKLVKVDVPSTLRNWSATKNPRDTIVFVWELHKWDKHHYKQTTFGVILVHERDSGNRKILIHDNLYNPNLCAVRWQIYKDKVLPLPDVLSGRVGEFLTTTILPRYNGNLPEGRGGAVRVDLDAPIVSVVELKPICPVSDN